MEEEMRVDRIVGNPSDSSGDERRKSDKSEDDEFEKKKKAIQLRDEEEEDGTERKWQRRKRGRPRRILTNADEQIRERDLIDKFKRKQQ